MHEAPYRYVRAGAFAYMGLLLADDQPGAEALRSHGLVTLHGGALTVVVARVVGTSLVAYGSKDASGRATRTRLSTAYTAAQMRTRSLYGRKARPMGALEMGEEPAGVVVASHRRSR
jgi:hypothetical protein